MYETLDSRRGIIFAAGLIVLATMAAYSNSLSGPFLFDDVPSIIENPTIRHLWPIGRILLPPGQYAAVQRRPLVNASLAINYAISGENTWSYHALNLAMHAAAALLLFGIVRRTLLLPRTQTRFARAATPLAATVALLWAVHPLLTDAVTYIIQRTEIMAGLFYLLAMYCTIRGATSPRAGRWYVAAAAACVAAMSSKEAAMSAPVVAAIYDRVFLSESWRQVWHRRGGLYLGMALGWILVLAMLPYGAEGTGVFGGPGEALEYAMAQSGVIAHYLQLAFWPHPLVFDYGMYDSESAAQIVPFIVLIVALALAVVEALRRWPWLGFLGVWFFAILAPSSSVIPLLQQIAAEKRMYLPLAAIVTAVVIGGFLAGQWLIRRGVASPRTLRIVGGCLAAVAAIACMALTFHRNFDYRSALAIWQDTVAKTPTNSRAHGNLGLALVALGRFDEGLAEYQKSLDIFPNYAAGYNNIGNILLRRRQVDQAIACYKKALAILPTYESAHNNIGNVLLARGQSDAALVHFQKALKNRPEHELTYNNIGSTLAGRGQIDDAIVFFRKAVELNPDFVDAHDNLGRALASRGRLDEAAVHFRTSLELRPRDAAARENLDRVMSQKADQAAGSTERRP